jgi:hypothetical protein
MSPFEICVYVGLAVAIMFLVAGLAMVIFGTKVRFTTQSPRLEINIAGHAISMPYNVSLVVCGIGVLLLFLVFDLSKGGAATTTGMNLLSSAYAQDAQKTVMAKSGWVYLGYERYPGEWNFQILGGSYSDLAQKPSSVKLKTRKTTPIRVNHFGNLTGTWVGFISPVPEQIGILEPDSCAQPEEWVSVGLNKVWLKVEPIACPQ